MVIDSESKWQRWINKARLRGRPFESDIELGDLDRLIDEENAHDGVRDDEIELFDRNDAVSNRETANENLDNVHENINENPNYNAYHDNANDDFRTYTDNTDGLRRRRPYHTMEIDDNPFGGAGGSSGGVGGVGGAAAGGFAGAVGAVGGTANAVGLGVAAAGMAGSAIGGLFSLLVVMVVETTIKDGY